MKTIYQPRIYRNFCKKSTSCYAMANFAKGKFEEKKAHTHTPSNLEACKKNNYLASK